jgi:hypothetical protein
MKCELPPSFFHSPPPGYSYEVHQFKRNILSIWISDHRTYDYNNGKPVSCIWGFYSEKTSQYHLPVNSKTVGSVIDIKRTSPYSAITPNLNPLMSCFQ